VVVPASWANAMVAVAAMKQADISIERTLPWFLIKSMGLLACSSGNNCSGGNVANEMSCWRDEGCPPVLLN
jgi:hypothetical protein